MSELRLEVSVDRDHVQGPETAPVTLVEYGDYECPYCGQAYPIVKEVQAEMGETLRFVFRNFPLAELHKHAQHAAEAAESAGAKGAFWPMHDLLFEKQRALADFHLKEYAEQVGIDSNELIADIQNGTFAPRVREDFLSGVRSGVNGTPTFFINGKRHNGAWDKESLIEALQAAAK
jgi:protein-disulfide isomerase